MTTFRSLAFAWGPLFGIPNPRLSLVSNARSIPMFSRNTGVGCVVRFCEALDMWIIRRLRVPEATRPGRPNRHGLGGAA